MKKYTKSFITLLVGSILLPSSIIYVTTEIFETTLKQPNIGMSLLILAFCIMSFTFGYYVSKPKEELKEIFK